LIDLRAICFGGEIDPRVLHGIGVGRYNKQSEYGITKKFNSN
jgi:hypothetical protein